jgi:site-specific DNA recombinase
LFNRKNSLLVSRSLINYPEEGLEKEFNSLDAQREACETYIKSQHHEGWNCLISSYDDGGFSGGNTDRPALCQLIDDIKSNQVDIVIQRG